MLIRRKRKMDENEMKEAVELQDANSLNESEEMAVETAESEEQNEINGEKPVEEAVDYVACSPIEKFRSQAEAFARGKGLDEEELNRGLEQLRIIGEGWQTSMLTLDMVDLLIKGIRYDNDVENAAAEGEIRGRNAVIEEEFMKEPESDGLPHLRSGGSVGKSGKINTIFDLAREA